MANKLSEKTLNRAKEALLGKWGQELKPTSLVLTEEEYNQNRDKMYAACVRHIAEEGEIRIDPDELLIGAATLKESAYHVVPVRRPD